MNGEVDVEVDLVEDKVAVLVQNTITNVYDNYASNEYPTTHHQKHELCACRTPSAIAFCGDNTVRLSGDFAVFYLDR
ncbi:MAG: hypothetical protein IK132_06155 [Clostridia bacterium]|nr:hypothetical protein [Clostridia bacterium]